MHLNQHSPEIVLLITARDPATAFTVCVLLKTLDKDERFRVHIAAQHPAYEIFKKNIVASKVTLYKFSEFQNDDLMLETAHNLLLEISPDVILTGISGPDYGLDEAMLSIAPKSKYGPYALQSYWGDINKNLSGRAKTYFVNDSFAARLTHKRTTGHINIVGSLKHELYSDIDIKYLRDNFRDSLCKNSKVNIIGFYGQPLEDINGYKETILSFSQSILELENDILIVYRPHQKESQDLQKWTKEKLQLSGKELVLDNNEEIEPSLCGCDIIVSAFSTCCYDAQQLIKSSLTPLGIPVYLMFNPHLVDWYKKYTKLDNIPMTESGMAVEITDSTTMTQTMSSMFGYESQRACWESIRNHFPDSMNASKNIVNVIYKNYKNEI